MIRRSIVPFLIAVMAGSAGQAVAQGGFPAPLPGQSQSQTQSQGQGQANNPFPPVNGQARTNASAFPPINPGTPSASVGAPSAGSFPSAGASPFGGGFAPPQAAGPPGGRDCMKEFTPLREDAERRGKMIKAASDRHATPDEACKLIRNFGQAEVKMISYVTTNAARCGIPAQIGDQLKAGHKGTETLLTKVCGVAQQMQQRQQAPAGPTLSDVLGSSAALPEANTSKKGGSTFDTLNGNVLTR